MKTQLRRAFFIVGGAVFFAGCALQMPTVVKHSLWTETQTLNAPPDFHLVLVWKENEKGDTDHKLSQPEKLADALSKEYAARNAGKMISYQIVESASELEPWLEVWSPDTPVLFVNARFKTEISTTAWTAGLSGYARFQALLFDTSLDKTDVQAKIVKRREVGISYQYRRFIKEWLEKGEPELYADFSKRLAAEMPVLQRKETVLHIFGGKSPALKEAQLLAQKSDWTGATSIWQEELKRDPKNNKIHHNLSVASEMTGDWKGALSHQKSFAESSRPKGLGSLLSLGSLIAQAADSEREIMLSGMAALKDPQKQKKKILNADSTFAVLLFENMTNDLNAPVRVREEVAGAAKKLGLKLIPLKECDEKLRQGGFTDAGQFKATTVQELGKLVGADFLVMGNVNQFRQLPMEEVQAELKVTHGLSGKAVFSKTFHVIPQSESSNVGGTFSVIDKAAGMLIKKARGAVLKEECEGLAARFTRAWPQFRR